ncbi:MAG: glycosyltransferase family 39 protein, partial [Anaerolineales bacterium]|nr:glycosyltransferase family 39 protein [Anaerolineales bacterium]
MTKAKYLGLVGILFLSAVLGGAQLTSGHNWAYSDFSSYIMQAQSIVNGTPADYIAHNSITVYQSDVEVGPVAYPWGYPLFLAPVVALLGMSTLGMKFINIIFYLGFLLALFFLFKRRLPLAENLALISLFAVSPVVLSFENYILSDIAFLFFSTLALYLIERFSRQPQFAGKLWGRSILGLGIFFAFLIRTNGLLLLLTLLIYEAFLLLAPRKEYKTSTSGLLILAAPYLIFVGLWGILSLLLPDGQGSHLSHYSYQTFAHIVENIQYYFRAGGEFLAPLPYADFLYYAFTLLFLVGIWTKIREEAILVLYFFLTFGLYVSWPDQQGLRFLLPILPLFTYFAWIGLRQLLGRIPDKMRQRALTLVWLLVFIPFLAESGRVAAS